MLLRSLLGRRSRVLVALLGISLGAAVLLGMVALSVDIPRQMEREFRSYGANMVLFPQNEGGLSLEQLEQVRSVLSTDALVGMTPFRFGPVRHGLLPYTLVATDFEALQKTSPFWRLTGDWPTAEDEIVVGADLAASARLGIGRTLVLEGRNSAQDKVDAPVRIVGIIKTGGEEDGFIFLSVKGWLAMYAEPYGADFVEISLSASTLDLEVAAQTIRREVPGVDARLVTRVAHGEQNVLGKLGVLVTLVAIIILTLTLICVATTMTTIVMERRREIGLKKALGADNRQIALEFMGEGLVLAVLGALVGCVAGVAFAEAVSFNVFGRLPPIPWRLVAPTVALCILVTLAACFWPVRRATAIEPALVLRGE